jgi:hypothetical protein
MPPGLWDLVEQEHAMMHQPHFTASARTADRLLRTRMRDIPASPPCPEKTDCSTFLFKLV